MVGRRKVRRGPIVWSKVGFTGKWESLTFPWVSLYCRGAFVSYLSFSPFLLVVLFFWGVGWSSCTYLRCIALQFVFLLALGNSWFSIGELGGVYKWGKVAIDGYGRGDQGTTLRFRVLSLIVPLI